MNPLAQYLIDRAFDQGAVVFLEGEPCQGLYIVREGSVKIYKLSAEGREQVFNHIWHERVVQSGRVRRRCESGKCCRACTKLWILPRAPIIDLIERRHDVAMAVIQNLGMRLRRREIQ